MSIPTRTRHLSQRSGRTNIGNLVRWEDCFRCPGHDLHPSITLELDVLSLKPSQRKFEPSTGTVPLRGNLHGRKSLDEDKVDHPRLGASFNHFFLINHGNSTAG